MCGRFVLNAEAKKLAREFAIEKGHDRLAKMKPRFNITPGSGVGVVYEDMHTTARSFDFFQWGLVPSWAKDVSISQNLSNARIETVFEKPTFRDAYRYRRCIVPATGFYEWDRRTKPRQPYYFYPQSGATMGFAGIWEHWLHPDGSEILSVTLMTRDGNEDISHIHHRMPVILEEQHWNDWLDVRRQKPEHIQAALSLKPVGSLCNHPVATDVNDARTDCSDLVLPIQPPEDPQLELF